jgi:hypothetical protein
LAVGAGFVIINPQIGDRIDAIGRAVKEERAISDLAADRAVIKENFDGGWFWFIGDLAVVKSENRFTITAVAKGEPN